MNYKIYQIDSFTNEIFRGNPACVVPLNEWLSDSILLKIAQENSVAETAFFISNKKSFELRWFTPDQEIDLCGHATLAAAYVLKSILKYPFSEIVFQTMSGTLKVNCVDNFYYLMFPSREPKKASLNKELELSLNIQPKEVFRSRDFMLVYDTQKEIEEIKINRYYFDQINLGHGGVIVTSRGISSDFVSRYFTPQATFLEDPVTGSAHCTLIPFWSSRLSKNKLLALQISERGGRLLCVNKLDHVIIGGEAVLYSKGKIRIK